MATCDDACHSGDADLAACVLECAAPLELSFLDVIQPVGLVCLSALFSGLTLGLMSLDTTGLEIIVAGGEEPDRSRAEKILPLRRAGNELLCTLLLSNTLVNALLSIFLGQLTSGVVGGILATAIIVIFGEIIPQATCSRHALLIGSMCIEPVRICMWVLKPITFPMAKALDWLLGQEIGGGHSKRELEHLLRMQETTEQTRETSEQWKGEGAPKGITSTEKKLLGGVLTLSEKCACDVMTDFDNIFMIEYSARLDFEGLREIYRSGYTRVPVYRSARNNLVGVLNTKDLVLVDADDELLVSEMMAACGRPIFCVPHNLRLDKMLNMFKQSRTHLALVQHTGEPIARGQSSDGGSSEVPARVEGVELMHTSSTRLADREITPAPMPPPPPALGDERRSSETEKPAALVGAVGLTDLDNSLHSGKPVVLASSGHLDDIVGIVTLEDVLEELLQAEIVDENDQVEDNVTLKTVEGKVKEMADRRFAFLDMLQHQPRAALLSGLGSGTGSASVGHLGCSEIRMTSTELAAVCSFLSGNVKEFSPSVLSPETLLSLIMQCKVCDVLPGTPAALLCCRAQPCGFAYLMLQGRVKVTAGAEAFKTEFGPWTILAPRSLLADGYEPDFTATVVEHARLLLISSTSYRLLALAAQDIRVASLMIKLGNDQDSPSQSRPVRATGGSASMDHVAWGTGNHSCMHGVAEGDMEDGVDARRHSSMPAEVQRLV